MNDCKYEIEIALLGSKMDTLIESHEKLTGLIIGNGVPGIKTEIAIAKESISRLWAAVGALFGVSTALCGYLFYWIMK